MLATIRHEKPENGKPKTPTTKREPWWITSSLRIIRTHSIRSCLTVTRPPPPPILKFALKQFPSQDRETLQFAVF